MSNVVGSLICGAGVARVGAAVSQTKYGRFLNQNRYLRVGPGRLQINGKAVAKSPRLAIGPQNKNLSKFVQKIRHINLKTPFVD